MAVLFLNKMTSRMRELWQRIRGTPLNNDPSSRVLNFLWLNLDLPAKPDPADGTIHEPLPALYIENARRAAKASPSAHVHFWVDSKRLTEKQMAYLKEKLETDIGNLKLKDLRSIPAYDQDRLYNAGETDRSWRTSGGKQALIWRQVDCAKILISLQGRYGQAFFADLDRSHFNMASEDAQTRLKKHGLMFGSDSQNEKWLNLENQVWGFTERRRAFFESYYNKAIVAAYNGQNAWRVLRTRTDKLCKKEKLKITDICFTILDDGTEAAHPDHAFRTGKGELAQPITIAFNPTADVRGTASTTQVSTAPQVKEQAP